MTCPHCQGNGVILAVFVMHTDGKPCDPIRTMPCPNCRATGEVDDCYPQWREQGAAMKRARLAREPYENMAEAADRLGVGLTHYSRMERGLDEPLPKEKVSDGE